MKNFLNFAIPFSTGLVVGGLAVSYHFKTNVSFQENAKEITASIKVQTPPLSSAAMSKQDIKEHLGELMKGVVIKQENMIYHESVDMYQIMLQGEMFYVAGDGSAIVKGSVLDVGLLWSHPEEADLTTQYDRAIAFARQQFSSSETVKTDFEYVESKEERKELLEELSPKDIIAFEPTEPYQDTLYVFFDINCPACSLFFPEIQKLQALGYRVAVVPVAKDGTSSISFRDTKKLLCQPEPTRALSLYVDKGYGNFVRQCEQDVDGNHSVFDRLGLQGTPYIFSKTTGRDFRGLHYANQIHNSLSGS